MIQDNVDVEDERSGFELTQVSMPFTLILLPDVVYNFTNSHIY